MSIKQTVKKVVQVGKAVVAGYKDYAQKDKEINAQAERNLSGTLGVSSEYDANKVGNEMNRLRKEQGVSFRNSVRSKLGL